MWSSTQRAGHIRLAKLFETLHNLTTCRDGVYEGALEVGVRTPSESIDFGTEIFMFTSTRVLDDTGGVGAN